MNCHQKKYYEHRELLYLMSFIIVLLIHNLNEFLITHKHIYEVMVNVSLADLKNTRTIFI